MATGPGGAVLTYDPTGRLSKVEKAGTVTRFEYLGPRLIAERDASGTILRRYVHGPGDDEPVVWYEAPGLFNRRFLHTDERGSIIAVSNDSGTSIATLKYDEYGIPQSTQALTPAASGRFMYTGQTYIPELGLYYYKARFYSPTLGRFMQTDPIGYKDGINWYAYVDSDPINRRDPSGLQSCEDGKACPDVPLPPKKDRQDLIKATGKPSTNGGDEKGANQYTTKDGQTRTEGGSAAGKGTPSSFTHENNAKEGETMTAISHTHSAPGGKDPKSAQNADRQNAPSELDQKAMNDGNVSVTTVGPSATTTMFREGGQDMLVVEKGTLSKSVVKDITNRGIIVVEDPEN